jgi:hypothetical protein
VSEDDTPTPTRSPFSDESTSVATFGGGNVVWDASDASKPIPPPSAISQGLAADRGAAQAVKPRHRTRAFVLLLTFALLVALGIAYASGALKGITGAFDTPTGPAILGSGTANVAAQTTQAAQTTTPPAGAVIAARSGTARTQASTPTPTRTKTATEAAALTATSTAIATVLLATASSTPSSTPIYTGGSLDAVLIYDDSQMVLINTRPYPINVSKLAFVQRGKTELRLQIASFWYATTPFASTDLPPQFCFQVFRVDRIQPTSLNNCHVAAWARVADSRWFWIAQDDSVSTFDVLSGDRVIATCSISARRCEIALS